MVPEGVPDTALGGSASDTFDRKCSKNVGKTNVSGKSRYSANPHGCRGAAAMPDGCFCHTMEGIDFG